MSIKTPNFQLAFTKKVTKKLKSLPAETRKQYEKAFKLLASEGPSYRSLRTHRYHQKHQDIWGSSASMALRFYWDYTAEKKILVTYLTSH
jgi:mRNA-degrading endonuclease YafQ of YafQ-DinJ toxin-antitoxin module